MRKGSSGPDRWFWVIRLGMLVILLALWEWTSGRWLDSWLISSPSRIALRLHRLAAGGELWPHLGATLGSLALGFPLGIAGGILLGLLLGWRPRLAELLEPLLVGFHGIPKVVLAPLFILWLGIGIGPKVALVALLSFFHNFFNTYAGLRRLDAGMVRYARLLGARGGGILKDVILPALSPQILTGIRSSLPLAFIGVTVGEFVAARRGLGLYVKEAVGLLDTTGALAGVVVLFLLIILANALLARLEDRLLGWMPRDRAVASWRG